jgi:hypothetical protein
MATEEQKIKMIAEWLRKNAAHVVVSVENNEGTRLPVEIQKARLIDDGGGPALEIRIGEVDIPF